MKALLLIIAMCFIIACSNKAEKKPVNIKVTENEGVIHLKSNFVINNDKMLNFIDSFLVRCQRSDISINSDINNYLFYLFIYQNDFFTRLKISYLPITSDFKRHASSGTGYFEYKGHIFIVITGLDRLCAPDSSLQKELQDKYKTKAVTNIDQLLKFGHIITWEADLTADTIFVKGGTINPFDPPPADSTILYKYIQSIKSFNPLVE